MKRPRRIKIVAGTRGSELALRQTGLVVERLQARWADLRFEIKLIKTRGGLAGLGMRPSVGQNNFEGSEFPTALLPREMFLPAAGQGVIAMQIRSGDEQFREIVDAITDFDTRLALRAEREFLRLLDADCNQPVGVLAVVDGPIMKIRGQIFDLGATAPREGLVQGPSEDAEKLAAQ